MSFDFTVKEFILGNGTGTPTLQFYRRGFNLGGGGSGPSWQDIILSGNTAVTLTNCKQNGLNAVRLFGNAEQRNLPKGYTQYEYLRSTGTQYIDLGYKGNGNTKVKIKFRYHTATSATGSGRVFGSRNTSQIDAFAIGSASGIVSAEGTNKVFWCYDGQPYYVDDTTFGLDVWKTVVFSATEHTIDGVTVGDDYEVTEFETPYNLKLFGFDNNGTIGVGYVDIAYCQLWDNGVLVRDLVPVGYGTTNSMYDKVSNTLQTNEGTGAFVAGTAVVPTPDEPINIISNNGTIKYSANMANVNEQTALVGYYISSSGVVTADSNNWIYQDFIPVKPSTTYTLTMSSSVYYVTISEYSTTDDSGFIIRKAGGSGDNTTLTITTESTTNYIRFGTNIDRSAVTLDRVLAIDWMLNQGNSMPYAPYSPTGIYTDGTTETVQVIGKNLFDVSENPLEQGGIASNDGQDAASSYNFRVRVNGYVPVMPNTTYTASVKDLQIYYLEYEQDTTYTTRHASGFADNSVTFTTGANTYFIRLQFRKSDNSNITPSEVTNVQLELGSTATTYEAYFNGGQATAEMLLKIGTYQDVQSVLDGEVTRNVGIKVFDGTESFSVINNTFRYNLSGLKMNTKMICSHFDGNVSPSTTTSNQPDLTIKNNQSNNNNAYIKYTAKTTVEDFKQWLTDQYNAGTPVIVAFQLIEPTTESVESQALTIQAGTNIVEITQASIDNLGLEVSYKGTV